MTKLLFVEALSPLHAGTGQSTGAVDLPIARERATDFPYLPGSSLKGALRDRARDVGGFPVAAMFGPETANASDHAGSLAFGDANLLLLPVRSVKGTFAYVTSPLLLTRLARDAQTAKLEGLASAAREAAAKVPATTDKCVVTAVTLLKLMLAEGEKVVFEDFDLVEDPQGTAAADKLAESLGVALFPMQGDEAMRTQLTGRLCLVHDDLMTYFARHGTDVVTRVSINEGTKTAKDGSLWTEENLPVATVLVSQVEGLHVDATKVRPQDLLAKLDTLVAKPLQLGGKASVGRGRCRLQMAGGDK